MLIGIIVPAWLLVLILCVYYVVGSDPTSDPFRNDYVTGTSCVAYCGPSLVDWIIYRKITKHIRPASVPNRETSRRLEDLFHKAGRV